MFSINLVPEVRKEQAQLKRLNFTMTVIAIAVGSIFVIAGLTLGAMFAYRNASLSSTNEDIATLNNELKAYAELEQAVAILEGGIADINAITTGSQDWTAFLGDVEKATPSDVRFTDFQITGNVISASLEGATVESIDRFITSFSSYQNDEHVSIFSGVIVDGYSVATDGGVSFDAGFTAAE